MLASMSVGADVILFPERRSPRGWVLPEIADGNPYDLIRYYAGFYILTGYVYRLDPDDLPAPIVPAPRGLPQDCSAEVRTEYSGDAPRSDASWLLAEELLHYDWEPFFALERQWHHRDEGDRDSLMSRLVDAVAALGSPEEHRLIGWLEW